MKHIEKMIDTLSKYYSLKEIEQPEHMIDLIIKNQLFLDNGKISHDELRTIQKGIIEMSLYSEVFINNKKFDTYKIYNLDTLLSQLRQEHIYQMFLEVTSDCSVKEFVDSHDKILNINIFKENDISYYITEPIFEKKFSIETLEQSPHKYYNLISSDFYMKSSADTKVFLEYLGYSTSKFLNKLDFYKVPPEKQAELLFYHIGVSSRVHDFTNKDEYGLELDFINISMDFKQRNNIYLFLIANHIHNPKLIETLYSSDVLKEIHKISLNSIQKILKEETPESLMFFNNYRLFSAHPISNETNDIIIFKENHWNNFNIIPTSIYNLEYLKIIKDIGEKIQSNNSPAINVKDFFIFRENNLVTISQDNLLNTYYEFLKEGINSLCLSNNVNFNPYYSAQISLISKISDDKSIELSFLDKYIMTMNTILCFDEMDDEHHIHQLDSFFELVDSYMLSKDNNDNKLKILNTLTLNKNFINNAKEDNLSKEDFANILFCRLEHNSKNSDLAEYQVFREMKAVYMEQILQNAPINNIKNNKKIKF